MLGQARIAAVGDDGKQRLEAFVALWRDDAECGEVRAQCVDGLCALPDQQVAHAVLHELCLLLRRLNRHCSGRRSSGGLTARRGIDRIVLAAFDIRQLETSMVDAADEVKCRKADISRVVRANPVA
jgi:hypothetical protein